MTKPERKEYAVGKITTNYAWVIAKRIGKSPPYRGYSLDLGNGQMLVNPPQGGFEIRAAFDLDSHPSEWSSYPIDPLGQG